MFFRYPANDIFKMAISFLETRINYKGPYQVSKDHSYVFSIKNLLLLLLTGEQLRHKLLHGDPPHTVVFETSLACSIQLAYDCVNSSCFYVDGL